MILRTSSRGGIFWKVSSLLNLLLFSVTTKGPRRSIPFGSSQKLFTENKISQSIRDTTTYSSTVFEKYPKCCIWIFILWQLCLSFRLSLSCQIGPFLAFFNELLSTQNVNVARFARNVEWDFFCDFRTPCTRVKYWGVNHKKFDTWQAILGSETITYLECYVRAVSATLIPQFRI